MLGFGGHKSLQLTASGLLPDHHDDLTSHVRSSRLVRAKGAGMKRSVERQSILLDSTVFCEPRFASPPCFAECRRRHYSRGNHFRDEPQIGQVIITATLAVARWTVMSCRVLPLPLLHHSTESVGCNCYAEQSLAWFRCAMSHCLCDGPRDAWRAGILPSMGTPAFLISRRSVFSSK